MGMYTEFVFGCTFKRDTPYEIIDYVEDAVNTEFKCGSYYTGFPKSVNCFKYDKIANAAILAIRCSIKNYGFEIQEFLKVIQPYILCGTGYSDFLGYYMYECDDEPTLIYLEEE